MIERNMSMYVCAYIPWIFDHDYSAYIEWPEQRYSYRVWEEEKEKKSVVLVHWILIVHSVLTYSTVYMPVHI